MHVLTCLNYKDTNVGSISTFETCYDAWGQQYATRESKDLV